MIFTASSFVYAMDKGLLPMCLRFYGNDGYKAIALSKDKNLLSAFWLDLKCNETKTGKIRFKDMPLEWFDVSINTEMRTVISENCGLIIYSRYMADHNFDKADALALNMLKNVKTLTMETYRLVTGDRIFRELIRENRRDVVESMLDRGQEQFLYTLKPYPYTLRIRYALALLYEDDMTKAENIRKSFDKLFPIYPNTDDIQSEQELMQLTLEKYLAQNRQTQNAVDVIPE